MQEEEPIQTLGLSASKSLESTTPAADNLQFQTAEYAPSDASRKCALCRGDIGEQYYHLGGNVICKVCAEQKQASQEPVRGRVLGKSVLYGLGAALGGSALYGVVLLATGAEFALLSILVGVMVGKAMLRGSGGRGGRKLQIIAVLLTYGSITTGYVPAIVKGLYQAQAKKEVPDKASGKSAAMPVAKPIGLGEALLAVAVALGFITGLALISPFLMLSQGFSGILSVAIIFFGLQQAWTKTRGDNRVLMGPYPVADLAPPAATA